MSIAPGNIMLPMATGAMVPLDADTAAISVALDLRAMAEHLGKVPRYIGATPGRVYSVAQHCCLVAEIAAARDPAAGFAAALHDGHEAMIGDISGRVEKLIARLVGFNPIPQVKDRLDEAIALHVGMPWPLPPRIAAIVAEADAIAFRTETRDLIHDDCARAMLADNPAGASWRKPVTECWPWDKAADRWLKCLADMAPLAGIPVPDACKSIVEEQVARARRRRERRGREAWGA